MKVCLFSHYYTKDNIPNYVLYWLEQLNKKVDKVILLTNDRSINNLKLLETMGVEIIKYPNKGYDFGMYHRWIMCHNVSCFSSLYLVNDSTVLFNSLEDVFYWLSRSEDLVGLTDSTEVSYHIQSYFWRLNGNIIPIFKEYLSEHGIIEDFNKVIRTYELGFCTHLLENNYTIKSKYSHNNYSKPGKLNSTIHNSSSLIDKGLPLIKKKVLLNTFNNDEREYLKSINYPFTKNYIEDIDNKKEHTLNIKYLTEL